jgi:dolichyl-phosphate beta-glucosyltransferase
VRWLYGVALTDEATCLKAFPTATLRAMQLASERFELCAELTAKACRMGVSILEVPIHYQPRTVAQGKKIRWRDGWKSVAMLWRCRHWTCRQPPRGDPADDRRGVPAVAGSRKPVISLVIPAYNECLRLPAFLKSARQYLDGEFAGNYEVIVVDDGSDDGTVAFLEDASAGWPQLSFVRHLENQGKGAAVRSGMRVAQGDYWLFADADGATPMAEERKLRGAIQRGADLAIGSRTLEAHATRRHRRAGRRMIGWLFRCCCRLVVGIRATDTQCGFKMFRADAGAWLFANLSERGFAFDLELLLRARAARYNLAEVPVAWNEIPGSKVRLFRDSLRMLKSLFAMRRRARSWPTAGRRGLRPIGIEPGVLVK